MTLTASSQAYTYEGRGTSTLTSAGKSWAKNIGIDAGGGTLLLGDNLVTSGQFNATSGIFDANDHNVTMRNFNGNAATLYMRSGTWEINGDVANLWTGFSLTIIPGTATIKLTGTLTANRNFQGANRTFPNYWNATSGAFAVTIVGSNTFSDIKADSGRLQYFTAGTTTTFTSLTMDGVTITSATASNHTLTCTSGTISVSNCTISRSTATGGADFQAYTENGNTDGGNNSGWVFSPPTIETIEVNDTGNISDSSDLEIEHEIVGSETSNIEDDSELEVDREIIRSEEVGISDNAQVNRVLTEVLTDTGNIEDSAEIEVEWNLEGSETAGIEDSADIVLEINEMVSDTSGVEESVDVDIIRTLEVDDTASVEDSAEMEVDREIIRSEDVGISDDAEVNRVITSEISDSTNIEDSAEIEVEWNLEGSETAGIEDQAILSRVIQEPATDTDGIADDAEADVIGTEVARQERIGMQDRMFIQGNNYGISINGNDVTLKVIFGSVRMKKNINQLGYTLSFSVRKYGTFDYTPNENDVVEFYDPSGQLIFSGPLSFTRKQIESPGLLVYDLTFSGWAIRFGTRRVVERYQNTTGNAIIADILTKYCPGFTANAVDADFEVVDVVFNRVTVTEALQRLAKYSNYSWYIDDEKDLHFFPKFAEPSPMQITESSANFVYDSLVVNDDFTQIRNRVFLRGGEIAGNSRTESHVADGEQQIIPLGNKFATIPTVTIMSDESGPGTSLVVGVDNLTNEEDADCFWSYSEKYIRFKDDTMPIAGEIVAVTGNPLYRLVLQVDDSGSITNLGGDPNGVREFVIQDSSIRSRDAAEARILAELEAYSAKIVEGEFISYETGFKPGQILQIETPSREISGSFLIQSVDMKMLTRNKAEWKITIATLRTIAIIDILIEQVRNNERGFEDSTDEVLERTYFINERIGISESVERDLDTPIANDMGITEQVQRNAGDPVFVAAPYIPISISDPKVTSHANKARAM